MPGYNQGEPRPLGRSSLAAPTPKTLPPAQLHGRRPAAEAGPSPSTVEARLARGAVGEALAWNAGLFRADNHRRHPVRRRRPGRLRLLQELRRDPPPGRRSWAAAGRYGQIRLGAPATPTCKATYRAPRRSTARPTAPTKARPRASKARSRSSPGDRIPLIPAHIFKAGAAWAATSRLTFSADMQGLGHVGGVYARGNENNQPRAGRPLLPRPEARPRPTSVFNLGAEYTLDGRYRPLFAQVEQPARQALLHRRPARRHRCSTRHGAGRRPARSPARSIDGERPMRNTTFYGPGAPGACGWASATP